ncbi:MAG: DUF3592 domain-containing protein [Clostridia bacterium]|nr:DUF3592 domain-containing protein [Clostridia bacterium]
MNIKNSIVSIIVGAVFLALGIFMLNQSNALKERCTEEASGTVVQMVEEISSDPDSTDYTYYPVVEYQAGDQTVSKKSSIGSNPSPYQVGDKVEVLYNPDEVEEFIIVGEDTGKIFQIIFIVIGAVILVVSLGKILLAVFFSLKK